MLSARRAQNACPNCRAQLLSLLETRFGTPSARPRLHGLANLNHSRSSPIASSKRPFSTTIRKLEEAQVDATPIPRQTPEDIELIVRQARGQFGDTLPRNYLNEEELKLYIRYYGAPLRETRPEDVGMPIDKALLRETHKWVFDKEKHVLLKDNEYGELEEVPYHASSIYQDPASAEEASTGVLDVSGLPSDAGIEYIKAVANNSREFGALLELQRDFERASLRATEDAEEVEELIIEEEEDPIEEEEEEDVIDEDGAEFALEEARDQERIHRLSQMGQWKTNPSTIHLPKNDFVAPITKLIGRTDIKHIKIAAEKAFGGPGLPHSVATPQAGKNSGQLPIPMEAGNTKYSEIEADTYISTLLPGMYASSMSVFTEIRKRMGPEWLRGLFRSNNGDGPRILDVGTSGAGAAAWDQVLKAEWDLMHEEKSKAAVMGPPGKKTVVVGSDHLRHRVSRFLNNTSFLPRLPEYLHSGFHPEKMDDSELPAPRKSYDIIIASHQLMPLKDSFKRKAFLDNLWEMLSPQGGVLIVLEKAHPRGFEAVADVRQRLLDEFIEAPTSEPQPETLESRSQRVREPGMIIAPCTNHKKCPMYITPGLSQGRKDFCHFNQRFIRPPFLQKILDASHRNHEDINFSFIAIQRGVTPTSPTPVSKFEGHAAGDAAFKGYEHAAEAPNMLALPRNILPPLKRTGHVTMEMCTPAGKIERWTVPKSFSRQAYHDARKASWGDLWALGAKTRVERPMRLGSGVVPNDGGIRARRAAEAIKAKGRRKVVNVEADEGGIYRATMKDGGKGRQPIERRTKGGRKILQRQVKNLLNEE
ncbi:mitochondrial small ribosomal subunit Rsm22-domain-containing protein [Xylariales sp. PMI_506]|nr:mitochondrial small ribosomal subunit Rsm22-domain-containing protein [Xylariales sp. PMI_506]